MWPASATSLRAWLPSSVNSTDLSTATYKWKLPEVANIKLDNDTRPNVILTPATVANDTVVPVTVDVQLVDGSKWTQQFTLLVQKPDPTALPTSTTPSTEAALPYAAFEDAAQVYPYVAINNPYADSLKKCVYARSIAGDHATVCKMSTLPLLGQSAIGAIPTVEEVMQRVLVSNDWMGHNFELFLRSNDNSGQLRRMLASTTAVVIGGRIRPSFYWELTGAIYLDADYLWTTPEERDTISERPDYRQAFGNAFNYSGASAKPFNFDLNYWFYRPIQGADVPDISIESRKTRTLADMRKNILFLMVHELTHALDAIPSQYFAYFSKENYVVDVAAYVRENKLSATSILGKTYPLSCHDCFMLGAVLFQGVTPTQTQKDLTVAQIKEWFIADNANDFYAYSVKDPDKDIVSAEDTAMLAEETLMQLSYGFRRYTFVLNYINDKYTFEWGQASRIGTPAIRQRAGLVLSTTAPWFDQTQLNQLESPTDIPPPPKSTSAVLKGGVPDYMAQMQLRKLIDRQMQDRTLRMQFKVQAATRLNAMRAARRLNVH